MNHTIDRTLTDENGFEMWLRFECSYRAGTPDYFCNGHGNYLPGDSPEYKIMDVLLNGKKLDGQSRDVFLSLYENEILKQLTREIEDAA